MSPVHRNCRLRTSLIAALTMIASFAPTAGSAQYGSTVYVCQTPTFWCSFAYP
jgi:hypothetical protein